MKDKVLVSDPFIGPNPLASHLNPDDISCDYLLITHGHQDHVADAVRIGKKNSATVISNYEIVTWFGEKGIQGHPMNHGGKWNFEFGTVKYVNAIHSSVLPDGTYGGHPGGFVLWNDEVSFYMAGDTALTLDMKLIPATCPKLDFAILPIGDNFTMGIDDAIIASDYIQCSRVVGCHYDTFGYIEIDHQEAIDKFKEAGKELILLDVGQTVDL
jgi:L-ascorbate metabolism protein UlaG (beta-lactamase superfamily)